MNRAQVRPTAGDPIRSFPDGDALRPTQASVQLLAFATAALLASCGGGGGGGQSADSAKMTPLAAKSQALPDSLPVPARAVEEQRDASTHGPRLRLAKPRPTRRRRSTTASYIVQLIEDPAIAIRAAAGFRDEAGQGQKIDPNTSDRGALRRLPDRPPRHDARQRRRQQPQGLQLRVRLRAAAELTDAQAAKLAMTAGVRHQQGRGPPADIVDAGLPRPERRRRFLEDDRRDRRRDRDRHRRRRHLARVAQLLRSHRQQRQRFQGRQARLSPASGMARPLHSGRPVQRLRLQPEADRCPLVQRRLGRRCRHPGPTALGIRLAPRLRRARHAHSVDGGRQFRRPDRRRRRGVRSDQRHGAACSHRGLQGVLGNRRRRLVLERSVAAIDQAVADGVDVINFSISGSTTSSSTRSRWPSCSRPTRASSSRHRPATAGRPRRPSRTGTVADDGGGGNAQPGRPGLGHAG